MLTGDLNILKEQNDNNYDERIETFLEKLKLAHAKPNRKPKQDLMFVQFV